MDYPHNELAPRIMIDRADKFLIAPTRLVRRHDEYQNTCMSALLDGRMLL